MKSFITGSHAYGTPHLDSDIDLVVHLSTEELVHLMRLANQNITDASTRSSKDTEAPDCPNRASLRFDTGDKVLNLICVTERWQWELWKEGTEDLKEIAPVTREQAVKKFDALRRRYAEERAANE